MAYNKHTWIPQEPITTDKLNNIENGIEAAKGDKGDPGDSYYTVNISGNNILNLDYIPGTASTNTVVMSPVNIYSERIDVTNINTLSFSIITEATSYNTDSTNVGARASLQFYGSTGSYVAGASTPWIKTASKTTAKIENITVNPQASYVVLHVYSTSRGNIYKFSQPMLNTGATVKPYTKGTDNLIKNSELSTGLSSWYNDPNMKARPSALSVFINTTQGTYNYVVENTEAVTGTLPDDLMGNELIGARISLRGPSSNGIGGIVQEIMYQGRVWQRTFGYDWYPWQELAGAYGSFDKSGVWHSLNGVPSKGGIIYNHHDDNFYALDPDGKVYTETGYQVLPVGINHKDLKVKLLEGGVVASDISDSTEAVDYINKINSYTKNLDSLGSLHSIVTDTHGTGRGQVLKFQNKILSGYQYVGLKDPTSEGIAPGTDVFVPQKSIDDLTSTYYYSIGRKMVNDNVLNIKRISNSFNVKPSVYSHLGDVEDGHNSTADEERQSYIESTSNLKAQGFNMIDGNHDEQIVPLEMSRIVKDGFTIGHPIENWVFNRRKDTDRWLESYGKQQGYYSIYDSPHKIVYIYLDMFEGGKVKNLTGETPDYGVKLSEGKLTAAQINWLVSELNKVPDDFYVVLNTHFLPDETVIGPNPTGSTLALYWSLNVNPDVLAGILIAFQDSSTYSGQSNIAKSNTYDFSAYNVSVNVDYQNKPKNRIIVWNYGHHHTVGHTTRAENGHFNIVQFPNMLNSDWGYLGNPSSSQHATEIIDVTNKKIRVVRFAPVRLNDPDFELDF